MLLEAATTAYLNFLKSTNSKHTSRNYERYLKRLLDFTGNIDVQNLNVELITRYHEFLNKWTDPESGKSLKAVTKNYYLIALRSLIVYLSQTQVLNVKAEDIFLEQQDPKFIEVLNLDTLVIVLKAPDLTSKEGLRDKLILEILANTGLRVSEVAGLDRSSLVLNKMEINFIVNRKNRSVKLPETVLSVFNAYMIARKDTFSPLFIRFQGLADPSESGEKMRLSERSIERIVQKYGKQAGVERLTPQILRSSLATNLLNDGQNVTEVAEILGHTNTGSTQVYARKIAV